MTFDHSQSYKGYGLRAIGHSHRLKTIFRELETLKISNGSQLCDLGCSNGYITEQIRDRFGLRALGLDHKNDHLVTGRQRYPEVEFDQIDLNQPYKGALRFDLVTCFETIEHVGNLQNAVQNIVARIAPGGKGLISVPIEHGPRGIIKYGIKKFFFQYSVSELSISDRDYRKLLLSGGRISVSRPAANSYGTHFGFDYRDVDDALTTEMASFVAQNRGMTRFYKILG